MKRKRQFVCSVKSQHVIWPREGTVLSSMNPVNAYSTYFSVSIAQGQFSFVTRRLHILLSLICTHVVQVWEAQATIRSDMHSCRCTKQDSSLLCRTPVPAYTEAGSCRTGIVLQGAFVFMKYIKRFCLCRR